MPSRQADGDVLGAGLDPPVGLVEAGPDGDPLDPVGVLDPPPVVGLGGEPVLGWADGLVDGFLPPVAALVPVAPGVAAVLGPAAPPGRRRAGGARGAVRRGLAGGRGAGRRGPGRRLVRGGRIAERAGDKQRDQAGGRRRGHAGGDHAGALALVRLRLVRLTQAGRTGGNGGPRHARRHRPLVGDVAWGAAPAAGRVEYRGVRGHSSLAAGGGQVVGARPGR